MADPEVVHVNPAELRKVADGIADVGPALARSGAIHRRRLPSTSTVNPVDQASTAGSRVTKACPRSGWPCPYQRSADATRPGDNTPRIIRTTGAVSRPRAGQPAVPGWGRCKR